MEAVKGIRIFDLALLIKKNLIIADTHIGYEEELNKRGILIPRIRQDELIKRMRRILIRTGKLERIIVNGDMKHEFGRISEEEWRNTIRFIDFLSDFCKEIVLIKGNHDTMLEPIARKKQVRIGDQLIIEKMMITHGDKIKETSKEIKTIIIGHEHPAITIREGSTGERYKCYLIGKWKNKDLIVQPSFNLVTEGTDVLKEKLLSPYLQKGISDFEVYVVEDKVYDFGKARDIKYYSK